jgi:hypothetical protein
VRSGRYNITEESDTETQFDSTYTVRYHHKQFGAFVALTPGEISRSVQCCGRTDRMETTNTYVIL